MFDYHQRVYKFSDFRKIGGRFFFEFIRAHLHFEALAGNAKSTVDSLRLPMLKNFPVPLPPLKEQATIVEYLDQAIRDIDTAITRANREIELLTEYRTRLIADVVTGKIDVREAAAGLPEVDPLAADAKADDLLGGDSEMDLDEIDALPEEVEA
jgi:type I restriction enzyme S subunit